MRLDVAFKGPMFMEHDVAIVGAGSAEAPGDAFEMYSGENERPSVVGRWRNVEASEALSLTARETLCAVRTRSKL